MTHLSSNQLGTEHQQESHSKTVVGFWMYLMSDCALFSILFATYAVLHTNTAGGPSGSDLFSLPSALTETLILLVSSFTCGLALIDVSKNKPERVLMWLGITFVLGLFFLTIELREFSAFVSEGNSWERSAFLSSFFTLVGTHGAHITVGLLWISVMMALVWRRGLIPSTLRRLSCLSLFWHFLDIVWIFIFTFVYLMEVAS